MGSLEEQLFKNTLTQTLQTIQGVLQAPTPLKPFELLMMYKAFILGSNDANMKDRNSIMPSLKNFKQIINLFGITILTGFFTKVMFVFGSTFTEQTPPNIFKQLRRQGFTYFGIYLFGWSITFFSFLLQKTKIRIYRNKKDQNNNVSDSDNLRTNSINNDQPKKVTDNKTGKIAVDNVKLKIGMAN